MNVLFPLVCPFPAFLMLSPIILYSWNELVTPHPHPRPTVLPPDQLCHHHHMHLPRIQPCTCRVPEEAPSSAPATGPDSSARPPPPFSALQTREPTVQPSSLRASGQDSLRPPSRQWPRALSCRSPSPVPLDFSLRVCSSNSIADRCVCTYRPGSRVSTLFMFSTLFCAQQVFVE